MNYFKINVAIASSSCTCVSNGVAPLHVHAHVREKENIVCVRLNSVSVLRAILSKIRCDSSKDLCISNVSITMPSGKR